MVEAGSPQAFGRLSLPGFRVPPGTVTEQKERLLKDVTRGVMVAIQHGSALAAVRSLGEFLGNTSPAHRTILAGCPLGG